MGAEQGALGRHACLSRAPLFLAFLAVCNPGRRLLTQAFVQSKFHENWATKLGIKKKGKGEDGSRKRARETKSLRQPH